MYKNAKTILLHLIYIRGKACIDLGTIWGLLFFVLDLFQVLHSVLIKIRYGELNNQV